MVKTVLLTGKQPFRICIWLENHKEYSHETKRLVYEAIVHSFQHRAKGHKCNTLVIFVIYSSKQV